MSRDIDPDSDPVLSLALSSKPLGLRAITEIADKQVRRAIQSVDGVGQVDLEIFRELDSSR